jgi:hypothetical protein
VKLTFQQIDSIPRLAWCAKLVKAGDTVEVLHGPWVETADDFFFEGAWSGAFQSREFETSQCVGSGGKVSGNRLLISTPSHTLERVFLLRTGRTLFLSNSFAFVLATAQDNVHPRALLYSVKLASITNGLREYAKWLPTRKGRRVRMFYHCNLFIDSRLHVTEEAKASVEAFQTFHAYKAFLLSHVAAIHANANDARRKIHYLPITTISSGYDSPAAAVLARSVGCKEALTFTQAREEFEDRTDSGAPIAQQLGMQVHAFDRLAYLREPGHPESEFFGWGAQESAWAKHLERRLLFTGFHGDKIWDRNCKEVTPDIKRGDPSGHNLNDFRLRVGWIHLPVPFLGCTSHPSINRISISKDMEPWSLKNEYDRPIPRRLLEEAGVERGRFGTAKRAVTLDLRGEGLRERMTRASFDDYMLYYRKHWNAWMTIKKRVAMQWKMLFRRYYALNRRVGALLKEKTAINCRLPVLIPRDMRITDYGDLDDLSLLMHWSTEKLVSKYTSQTRAATRVPEH